MATPICKIVDCNVINQELAFYEDAHCMLDGEPGIHMDPPTNDHHAHFGKSELDQLGDYPVSSALWRSYRQATGRLRSSIDTSLWASYYNTADQWRDVFAKLLTDPNVPVHFKDFWSPTAPLRTLAICATRSVEGAEYPTRPINIFFESSTDLPVPSPLATQLAQFLTEKVLEAGIKLPRNFMIEKQDSLSQPGQFRYVIFIPKGSCDSPSDT